jgi:Zn-dependent peptidase ImmA (M78 family)
MTTPNSTAKQPVEILAELGIVDAQDIDIEAIAQYCGATVLYKSLTGCEARIMGRDDVAIITVNEASAPERQRFSAAHELGHWMRDRGTAAFQCDQQSFVREWWAENPEKRANRFASDILMPAKIFRALAKGRPITFQTVEDLAALFRTSLSATAIRLVEYGSYPAMLVCNSRKGREWYVPSSNVREKLWPVDTPGSLTIAAALLKGFSPASPADRRADQWIKNYHPERYWIKEDSRRWYDSSVLTLVWWEDEAQLIDRETYEEESGSWRSDYRNTLE